MYKTEKQRRTEGRPSRYTAPELDRACAEYFRMCDGEGQKPTRAGLLLFLGLTEQAWGKMEEGAPGWYQGRSFLQAPEVDGLIYFTSPQPVWPGDVYPVSLQQSDVYDLIGDVSDEPAQ